MHFILLKSLNVSSLYSFERFDIPLKPKEKQEIDRISLSRSLSREWKEEFHIASFFSFLSQIEYV